MIEILDQTTENCLVAQFSGKVTGQEYQALLDAFVERLNTGGQVSFVAEFVGFEFYGDFDAATKDFKFGFGDYKRIYRAAFVGDQKWLGWFTRIIGPLTRTEEKYFPAGQLDEAVAWASE